MVRRLVRAAVAAGLVAVSLAALQPAVASAHPLGNFTINHYAQVRVGQRGIQLDVVIDMAEIPTFSERQHLDTNHDGVVDQTELAVARMPACRTLSASLVVTVDGRPEPISLDAAGLELLPGAGGLQTMRTVCEYTASSTGSAPPRQVVFQDRSYPDRIGWREIVVTGDGVTASAPGTETTTLSARLTRYPTALIVQPPDERSAVITIVPGGPRLGPIDVPDAQPVAASAPPMASATGLTGAVPGGVGDQLSSLIGAPSLTPVVVGLALLIAAALGAIHAVSPGHGKTVMAAYLVGTRGRARHAIGLAVAVTVSHTLGVLVLAALTWLASDIVPPERLYPFLGVGSGLTVVAIGAWLLMARWRDLALARAHAPGRPYASTHEHGTGNEPEGGHHHHDDAHAHRHGPFRHSHLVPQASREVSWRSLVTLGLAGGMVPSASALILLLGAVAAGRPALGLALALAFGVGMAVVLGGIGLVLAHAGRLLERAPAARLARMAPVVPWMTAAIVLVAGFVLTGEALIPRF